MEEFDMLNLLKETLIYVLNTLIHNGLVLALGIIVAAAITVYVDPEKMRKAITKKSAVSIGGSVAFGTFTPFCACGTMAVIVAMMTTALPWGPIMAFLTSSPLMSPDEFILYSGIISFKFAVALAVASVIVGLGSGYITHLVENHTRFFDGQARFTEIEACNCEGNTAKVAIGREGEGAIVQRVAECCTDCSCSGETTTTKTSFISKYKVKQLLKVFVEVGVKQVLVYFSIFAAIGFLINKFVPAALILKYMGAGNKLAVPLLALIGLPLYVNGSSAIPIINSLIGGGASQGALLAFMITGPGTSAGVIAGMLTIMKKKAIGLYVAYFCWFLP